MTKYSIKTTKIYRRQLRLMHKRGYNMSLLDNVIALLADGQTLPSKYRDHPLTGNMRGYRDCHIKDDWVLIYRIDKNILKLMLVQTGTHSDILD